jgi:hypothetical protein
MGEQTDGANAANVIAGEPHPPQPVPPTTIGASAPTISTEPRRSNEVFTLANLRNRDANPRCEGGVT